MNQKSQKGLLISQFCNGVAHLVGPMACLAGLVVGLVSCGKKNTKPAVDVYAGKHEALEKMLEAPVRLVWQQKHQLWKYDTAIAGPPTVAMETNADSALTRPLLSADGETIVYGQQGKIRSRSWSGASGEERELADGVPAALWRDPSTQKDYVYFSPTTAGEKLCRLPLEGGTVEVVWSEAPFIPQTVTLSADGTRFNAVFYGTAAGQAHIKTKHWQKFYDRPLISIASDDSYLSFLVDGTQQALRVFTPETLRTNVMANDGEIPTTWRIPLTELYNKASAVFDDYNIENLASTSHPQVLAFGMAARSFDGSERLSSAIAVAQLTADALYVEKAWAMPTVSREPITHISAAVLKRETKPLENFAQKTESVAPIERDEYDTLLVWPARAEYTQFAWESAFMPNLIKGRPEVSTITARGVGRYGNWGELLLGDGATYEIPPSLATEWMKKAAEANKFTISFNFFESVEESRPTTVRLLTLINDAGETLLNFSRVNDDLVLRIKARMATENLVTEFPAVFKSQPIMLGNLTNILVSYDGTHPQGPHALLQTFGGLAVEFQPLQLKDLSEWTKSTNARVVIGDENHDVKVQWRSNLEMLQLTHDVPNLRDVNDFSSYGARRIRNRTQPINIHVIAVLEESAVLPASLTAQTALVQNVYRIEKTIGRAIEYERIGVLHYAKLNGQLTKSVPAEIGKSYELIASEIVDVPQVEITHVQMSRTGARVPLYLDQTIPSLTGPAVIPPSLLFTSDEKE